ncbi:cytochrome P450 315a1, mitochondrial [Teleopsis dalmanni]|uniref:cytochrome P450 315a1, mitochondrial n=1 Tax=Teleopsis dalmanni TaxID=139649 RepID=UPI0018CE6918|nr:cytochrome P450 315a1, mitochondrial [Teleopsis dalmanni]
MSNARKLLSYILRSLKSLWVKILIIFKYRTSLKYRTTRQSSDKDNTNKTSKSDYHIVRAIPETKGLPVVGTLFELMSAGGAAKLHEYIDKRHAEHGPIFRERLGGKQDAVFVSSASLMRNVFLHEGQYPQHPIPDAWKLYNEKYKCERGLFFMDGEEWLHNRRIMNKFLINGNLNWMDAYIETSTEKVINKWKKQCLALQPESENFIKIYDLELQLYHWAVDVVCTIMFGPNYDNNDEILTGLCDFSRVVNKIFKSSSNLMNFPPKLAKLLNLEIWTEFEEHVTDVLFRSSQIIDLFIEQINEENEKEEVPDTAPIFFKLKSAGMSHEMIKRIFVDLVIAAGDTTAYTTEWALYLLSQNSLLQQKIYKDIQQNAAEAQLVNGLLKETLRLYPVAPFIGRYLADDATLEDYSIEKNTLVLLSLYTAGRDAKHFPQPFTVMPERWKRNEKTGELKNVLQAHGTLPFAIGSRSCIGRKIATNQIKSFLTAICNNFQLKCLNEKPIERILRLVTVPNEQLRLSIKLRQAS